MTISTFERNATIAEMAVEIDRRGAVIEKLEAALLSERHRAEEAMRERARNRLLELKRVRPDGAAWLLLAANAVNDLPLTTEPTHER